MPCIALCKVSFIETLLVYFHFVHLRLPPPLAAVKSDDSIFSVLLPFYLNIITRWDVCLGCCLGAAAGGIIHFHCYSPTLVSGVCVYRETVFYYLHISTLLPTSPIMFIVCQRVNGSSCLDLDLIFPSDSFFHIQSI